MKIALKNKISMNKLIRVYLHVTTNTRSAKFWTLHLHGITKELATNLLHTQTALAKVLLERSDIDVIFDELHSLHEGIVLEDISQTKRFYERVGIDTEGFENHGK